MKNDVLIASCIPYRGLLPDQNPVKLIFNPIRRSIHDVEMRTGRGLDPLISRLPEAIVNFRGLAEERSPELHGYFTQSIDIEVEIRFRVIFARAARSCDDNGYDLWQFTKALR